MRFKIKSSGLKTIINHFFLMLIVIAPAIFFSSCSTPKNAYYFKNLQKDTSINTIGRGEDLKIQKNDLLQINFSSLNPVEDINYNAPAMNGTAAAAASATSGYEVDQQGNIQIRKLGVLHVEGMTRAFLKAKLQKEVSPFLLDPVVTVRFLNHKITVLGEVIKPQVIQMPEERLSILDVLGSSGDVTQIARRDNILVIRETTAGKDFKRINLEDQSVFTSSYYWLQPGDVVYVEPSTVKIDEAKRAQRQQNISIGLSALSIAVIILNILVK